MGGAGDFSPEDATCSSFLVGVVTEESPPRLPLLPLTPLLDEAPPPLTTPPPPPPAVVAPFLTCFMFFLGACGGISGGIMTRADIF